MNAKPIPSCRRLTQMLLLIVGFVLAALSVRAQTLPLSIHCPSNITLWTCGTTAFYQFPPPTVTGGCAPYNITCQPPSGSAFPIGDTKVDCRVIDGCDKVDTCSFIITVKRDTEPPKIDCPSNITVRICAPAGTPCAGPANYVPPTATDDSGSVIVVCNPPPGTVLNCGTYDVSCTAIDRCERTDTCRFKLTIEPGGQRPVIQCPPDLTITTCSNSAVLNYPLPTVVPLGTPIVCNPPIGTVLAVGSYAVHCIAQNTCGVDECVFKVDIRQVPPPTIQCPVTPAPLTFTVPCGSNCVPVNYPLPGVSNGTLIGCNPPPGTCLAVGNYVVTCRAANDCGVVVGCEFPIQVVPGQGNPPQIVCPNDMVFTSCSNFFQVFYPAPIVNPSGTAVVCTPPSGAFLPVGNTTVTCVASNACGTNQCSFRITVRQVPPPTIQCPTNPIVLTVPCGSNCVPIVYPLPTVSNGTLAGCIPPIGTCLPVGSHVVVCRATNECGVIVGCTFDIRIIQGQGEPPRIICPSNIVVWTCDTIGRPVNYPPPIVFPGTDPNPTVSCTPPSGSMFPVGVTTVTCTVKDDCGNENKCQFTVTVRVDNVPPVITCPPNQVVTNCTAAGVVVNYPKPTATDNADPNPTITCVPPPGSVFPQGVTTVLCEAKDECGNVDRCTFTVRVFCPQTNCVEMVCPTNIIVDCAGPNGAVATFDAYALDTCTGAKLPVNCSRPSGSFFPIGTTTVCCTNTIGGASQVCCFTVTVKNDTEPPTIHCPKDIYVLCAHPQGERVRYTVTATDNCDTNVQVVCFPPSGSVFPTGCTNVTCVATDDSGRTATCTFKVCVIRSGCYLKNPSFELLQANLPPPNACGDPLGFAQDWVALTGTPDLWRPPFASVAPGNCRGQERPCQGTNYAGFEGGYTASGGFATESMMGTIIAPLSNGQKFRLRACLSLAEISPGPVFVEFVLANSAAPAAEHVIHQVWVTQKAGWQQYQPPCFVVPTNGSWDRLIIRAARTTAATAAPYPAGYVYVDNVNICCCKPVLQPPVFSPNGVLVAWQGEAKLQATRALGGPDTDWQDVETPVDYDPETDTFSTKLPAVQGNLFFRLVTSDEGSIECSECSGGGSPMGEEPMGGDPMGMPM